MAGSIYLSAGGQALGPGDCPIFARIDRRIASSDTFLSQLAGFKCNCPRHALAAMWESKMEMQTQAAGTTTMGIIREMLTLALRALVSGAAVAAVAGLLVVVLTIIAE